MAARRKKHAAHDEEHENHERWLITYADMITLLMVLFIVLYAIGQTDLAKFEELKAGLSQSLGGHASADAIDNAIGTPGEGVLSGSTSPVPLDAMQALEREESAAEAAQAEQQSFAEAQSTIEAELQAVGLGGSVEFRVEERGLVVTIVVDNVLFDIGSADLRAEGRAIIDHLAGALGQLPNPIAVEGHTDDSPIRGGGQYASNWELSTARATSVLRYLIEAHAVPADRVSASGYADQRPVAANDTPDGRARNRRVEIVVLSTTARNGES
jgi:chemotaxis protein MotB